MLQSGGPDRPAPVREVAMLQSVEMLRRYAIAARDGDIRGDIPALRLQA